MPSLDPIQLEIVWQQLVSVADEIGHTVVRTSFSNTVKDNQDFACTVFDGQARLLAQSTLSVPAFIGTTSRALRTMLQKYPAESLAPGDVIVTNDPWICAGHLHDTMLAMPVFHDSRIVGYVANIAHLPDVGGALSPVAREVFAEGLFLPILKLVKAGEDNSDLFDVIRANVRIPDEVVGDLRAIISALHVGAGRLRTLVDEHRLEDLIEVGDEIIGRSEAYMREQIRRLLPEGDYADEDYAEGFGDPLRIALTMSVRDSNVHIDFDGTAPQVELPYNSVLNYTYAYSVFPLKCALDPDTPNNDGSFRPFTVDAPLGSLANARHPAAVWARHVSAMIFPSVVFGAIAKPLPGRTIADAGSAPAWIGYLRGRNSADRPFVHMVFMNGGLGGRQGLDGISAFSFPSNVQNASAEIVENTAPFRLLRRRLLPDSGGPGEFRGGLGEELAYEVRNPTPVHLGIRFEHSTHGPRGFLGGQPGQPGETRINGQVVPSKGEYVVRQGDLMQFFTAGGGGYGDPRRRDPALVAQDVRRGYVTAEGAERDYGVAFDPATGLMDPDRTAVLRTGVFTAESAEKSIEISALSAVNPSSSFGREVHR